MPSLEDRVSLLESQVEAMRNLFKIMIETYDYGIEITLQSVDSITDQQQALKKELSKSVQQQALKKDLPKSVGEV